MSVFKKIKSIFIEEDGSPVSTQNKVETTVAPPVSVPPKTAISGSAATAAKPNADAKADEKFIEMLLKAIEQNNIEGFDYLEYRQSLQSLSKIEPDESKRFQSAFAMASTMGLTKKTLNDSATKYLQVLATEEKKFGEAFENQRSSQITNREQRGRDLQATIDEANAQIKELQNRIAQAEKEQSTIESEIAKALAKVESTKDSFYASYQIVAGQIAADLEKMAKYLG